MTNPVCISLDPDESIQQLLEQRGHPLLRRERPTAHVHREFVLKHLTTFHQYLFFLHYLEFLSILSCPITAVKIESFRLQFLVGKKKWKWKGCANRQVYLVLQDYEYLKRMEENHLTTRSLTNFPCFNLFNFSLSLRKGKRYFED